ncbi:putative structural maintenance of chromosomes protein [Helicobacter phage Pt5303G]|nr:putative structural maintenance of chromosomes protein [Helicobacter phage Pt5303G]
MAFYFDITAPYPGGQSAPYIPRFEPLSPLNDGTTGQGAGQGIPPRINWGGIINKDQESVFHALGSRVKDLAGSLDAYKGALEKASRMENRYNSSLHDYNANINSLEHIKKERHDLFTTAKRLKDLIRQEKEKKQRFSKELRLFFDFQEKEDDKQENIFQGLFKRKEFKALDAFLTNPYAILPKGFIFEYHNPGSNNYNPLNAFNPMDGINNQFTINTLNQVNNNSFQRSLAGGADFNYFVPLNFAKALNVDQMVFSFENSVKIRRAWAFFLQNKWYVNGYKLKIIDAKIKTTKVLEDLQESIREKERELEDERRKQNANEENIKALTEQILEKSKELQKIREQLEQEYRIISEFTNKKQSILNEINHSNLNENLKHGFRDIVNDLNLLKTFLEI